jgi:hypothetical protein
LAARSVPVTIVDLLGSPLKVTYAADIAQRIVSITCNATDVVGLRENVIGVGVARISCRFSKTGRVCPYTFGEITRRIEEVFGRVTVGVCYLEVGDPIAIKIRIVVPAP